APHRYRVRDPQPPFAVHLRGIDMGHAELDAAAECRNRASAIAAIDVPGALPDDRHIGAATSEFLFTQSVASFVLQARCATLDEPDLDVPVEPAKGFS